MLEICNEKLNTAELIIAKQRHGPIGTIKTHFDSNFTNHRDISVCNAVSTGHHETYYASGIETG